MPITIASGATEPGNTEWQLWTKGVCGGVFVDIDTSGGGFESVPKYFTSIQGTGSHWNTTGATSIYLASRTQFRVYVRWIDGGPLDPDTANKNMWHINWLGVEG